MRLQKYIANAGITSRRKAEELIKAGKVSVNGFKVTRMGVQIDPEKDFVEVGGKLIEAETKVYLMLHKPEGYTCTKRRFKGEKNIYEIVPQEYHSLNPVGRLDKDSSGLLLMSNDGDWANDITHPRNQIEKEYVVTLNRPIEEAGERKILNGIREGGEMLKAKKIQKFNPMKYSITLTEGKNREIRRMIKAVGSGIVSLKRIRVGKWKLGTLKSGEFQVIKK